MKKEKNEKTGRDDLPASSSSPVASREKPLGKGTGARKKKPPLWFRLLRMLYVAAVSVGQAVKKAFFVVVEGIFTLYFKTKRAILQKKRRRLEEKKSHRSLEKESKKSPLEKRRAVGMRKKRAREKESAFSGFLEDEEQDRSLLLRKQGRRKRIATRATLFFLLTVLLLQTIFFAFAGVLYLKSTGVSFPFGRMELCLQEGKSKTIKKISFARGYDENHRPMVDMTALADFLDLSTVNDQKKVYYTLSDGKRIALERDGKTAVLDGVPVTLSSPVRIVGSRVYVPLELITQYTSGLGVSYSGQDHRLTLSREKDEEASTVRVPVYKDFSVTVSSIQAAPLPGFASQTQED